MYFYNARYYDPVTGRFISADTIVPNFADPQTLNRYSYCRNNPLRYVDPTGHFSFDDFFKSVFSGFVGGAVYVFSGGNPVLAGMAAGSVGGALTGRAENAAIGMIAGGFLGGVGGAVASAFGEAGVYGMVAAGAGAAYATKGVDGLAYYAGGLAGGIAGSVMASNITAPALAAGQPIEDDPLHYDGKQLTATDAGGNQVGSWPATSGQPGTTTSVTDQMARDTGPIPAGGYSVDPTKIQRWGDLPLYQKIAAYLPGKHGEWPGGVVAWGHTRVPIDIPGGAVVFNTPAGSYTRGDFFIHGGWDPGSAGCIDLGAYEGSFFNYFSGQTGSIPLTVSY